MAFLVRRKPKFQDLAVGCGDTMAASDVAYADDSDISGAVRN